MRIIDDVIQGTEEWHQLRAGRVTASHFKDVMAKGQGKTRKRYMYHLLAERITGQAIEARFINDAMRHGTETEAQARACYELDKKVDVVEVGFVEMNEHVGASPDGVIFSEYPQGGIEIRCPDTHNHIECMLTQKPPTDKWAQIQGNLWVCEADWWDYVSFDPRVSGREMVVIRVNRDKKYIAQLQVEVSEFVEEMLTLENRLNGDLTKLLRDSVREAS